MKSLVIALAFCAGSAIAGTAAAGCEAHGSMDAKAPSQDKALLAQTVVKTPATPVVAKTEAKADTKAKAVVRAETEERKSAAL